MVKIEYNDTAINVPEAWEEVTVGHYETFYNDKPETARERVAYMAKICKTTTAELLDLPAELFNLIVDTTAFLHGENYVNPDPVVMISGVKYIIPVEDKLSTGAWIDAEEVQKGETGNLSGLLAIVCRPAGEAYSLDNLEDRTAMFAALPVSKVLGVLAFFLRCTYALELNTAAFLRVKALADRLPRNIQTLQKPGAGIKPFRIWQIIKYYSLILLLDYRLRKFSRSYNTVKTKTTPTAPSAN